MHLYLLVDCAVRHDAAKTLRFYASHLPHRALFQGQPEQLHAETGPWLVQIDHDNSLHGWLNALERTGTATPCVSELRSEESFETVYAHLQSLLDLHLPDGTHCLLRFYDPRVMKRLHSVLTAEQFHSMIAPFRQWRTNQGQYPHHAH